MPGLCEDVKPCFFLQQDQVVGHVRYQPEFSKKQAEMGW